MTNETKTLQELQIEFEDVTNIINGLKKRRAWALRQNDDAKVAQTDAMLARMRTKRNALDDAIFRQMLGHEIMRTLAKLRK